MKIRNVLIDNWRPPGDEWWAKVAAKPDEPLIEATFFITLSWREYHSLVFLERQSENPVSPAGSATPPQVASHGPAGAPPLL
jgi:hypothetical protein